ncbi:MAG: 30S ribosomal protein S27e [Nanoarchaeota archaeon]|nr:30S ribosomal protein S27e [Nanoarchaeota archaeon]|tara:strand:- start:5873 stop:6055 length:183 start_codon:yes stop_codon:yes gene_type:complete
MKTSNPKSKFMKLRCSKCKNEQIVFNKPSSKVKCLVCGVSILEPLGGKGKVKAQILEVVD